MHLTFGNSLVVTVIKVKNRSPSTGDGLCQYLFTLILVRFKKTPSHTSPLLEGVIRIKISDSTMAERLLERSRMGLAGERMMRVTALRFCRRSVRGQPGMEQAVIHHFKWDYTNTHTFRHIQLWKCLGFISSTKVIMVTT